MAIIPFKARQIVTDEKGIGESCIAFDIEAGHNHDGVNSRAISAPATDTQTIIARVFSRPKLADILVGTNDPRDLDGLIVETVAGNITRDLDKMEIIGGSATTTGHSWMYWDLVSSVTKVFLRVRMKQVDSRYAYLEVCDASGATLVNPPNLYYLELVTALGSADLRLGKNIAGSGVILAQESVDLDPNKFYNTEFYYEGNGTGSNKIMIWRDGDLAIEISETETGFLSVASIRYRAYDNSTTVAQKGHYSRPFVILTEA